VSEGQATRLLGGVRYVLLDTLPRLYAEGIRLRLQEAQIPVYTETPFTSVGITEVYLGTYVGDVSLWVPEDRYTEAVWLLQRGQQEEP